MFLVLVTSPSYLPAQRSKSQEAPLSIDLRHFGFQPISERDFKRGDAELFATKNYDQRMQLMETWDDHTKTAFLSNHILAVYHSRQQVLEAMFLNAQNGALLRKQEWPVRIRHASSDLLDSEARIYPVKDDKFVVCAGDKLTLYSLDYKVLHEMAVPTKGWQDRWSVQVLPGGDQIFLRRELGGKVEYSWLDVDSFRVIHTEPGIRTPNFDVRGGVLASEHFVFADKIYSATDTSHAEAYPPGDCPRGVSDLTLGQDQLLKYGDCGFNVFKGTAKLWGRGSNDPKRIAHGFAERNLSGTRFLLNYVGDRRSVIDGVAISEDGTFLVYDVIAQKLVFSLSNQKLSWDNTAALSPDGTKLAVLNGASVRIFRIP